MLGGLLLAPVLIVHILVEHLMYAWKIITCSCFNSAHIDRTSDMMLGKLLLAPVLIVQILVEHLMYVW